MEIFIFLVIAAVIAWGGYLAYQRSLGQQLNTPTNTQSTQHPTMLFQVGMAAAGGRGWQPSGSGTSLTISRTTGRTGLLFQFTPSDSGGATVTATATNIQKGSTLGITTYPNANAILNKRREVLAAMR